MLLQFSRVAQLTFVLLFVSQGNKGGVSVHLSFYGHLLCFLNCHLAAHMNYASERVDEFEYIIDTQTFECKKAPRIVDHRWCSNSNVEIWIWHTFRDNCLCTIPRLVFWFGDLNFRIQDHGMHFVRSCINRQTYNLLWSKDQVGKQSPRHLGCVISPGSFWFLSEIMKTLFSFAVDDDEAEGAAAAGVWRRTSGLSAHLQVRPKLWWVR